MYLIFVWIFEVCVCNLNTCNLANKFYLYRKLQSHAAVCVRYHNEHIQIIHRKILIFRLHKEKIFYGFLTVQLLGVSSKTLKRSEKRKPMPKLYSFTSPQHEQTVPTKRPKNLILTLYEKEKPFFDLISNSFWAY